MQRKNLIKLLIFAFVTIGTFVVAINWDGLSSGDFPFIENHVKKSPQELVDSMSIPEKYHNQGSSSSGSGSGRDAGGASGSSAESDAGAAQSETSAQSAGTSSNAGSSAALLVSDPEVRRQMAAESLTNAARSEMVGDYQQALEQYDLARRLEPQNATAQAAWGKLAFSLARTDEQRGAALSALGTAASLDPQEPDYRVEYARALVHAGRSDEARQQLRQALEQVPGNRRIQSMLDALGN